VSAFGASLAKVGALVRRRREQNRRRPRRRARLTREGKAFSFVTLGVGVAAVNTGNNLLFLMLGLMISLVLLSMVLSEIALQKVTVARNLPRRAFAQTPTLVELVLTNEKRHLPSYSLEVEDRAKSEPSDRRCYFLKVAPDGEQIAAYQRVPQRRGLFAFAGYRVGTRYPFGLVEKAYVHEDEGELLVFPELVDVDGEELRGLLDGADHPVPRVGPGTEVAGLREYHIGDEARSIHWRRSAALNKLVVRERQRDAAARITLVIDNARPDGATEAWDVGFEDAISRAASLAAEAAARGAAVDVAVRGQKSPLVLPASPPDPIWRFLAELSTAGASAAHPNGGNSPVVIAVVPRDPPAPDAAAGGTEGRGAA